MGTTLRFKREVDSFFSDVKNVFTKFSLKKHIYCLHHVLTHLLTR
jgi:hypothetical protein